MRTGSARLEAPGAQRLARLTRFHAARAARLARRLIPRGSRMVLGLHDRADGMLCLRWWNADGCLCAEVSVTPAHFAPRETDEGALQRTAARLLTCLRLQSDGAGTGEINLITDGDSVCLMAMEPFLGAEIMEPVTIH